MHGLTGGSWKRNKDRTRATEMKDTRGNLAVTSGSETYRRCALPRQLSTLLPRRNRHNDQSSQPPNKVNNLTMPREPYWTFVAVQHPGGFQPPRAPAA